jgi:hypothetical protein
VRVRSLVDEGEAPERALPQVPERGAPWASIEQARVEAHPAQPEVGDMRGAPEVTQPIPPKKMKRIYVAGPFTAPTRQGVTDNINAAISYGESIDRLGGNAFVPHIFDRWDARFPAGYERWMKKCLDEVARCDALFLMNGPSPGAQREVKLARSLGIPVINTWREVELIIAGERIGEAE